MILSEGFLVFLNIFFYFLYLFIYIYILYLYVSFIIIVYPPHTLILFIYIRDIFFVNYLWMILSEERHCEGFSLSFSIFSIFYLYLYSLSIAFFLSLLPILLYFFSIYNFFCTFSIYFILFSRLTFSNSLFLSLRFILLFF